MKNFFGQLIKNLKDCFYGKIFVWHVTAILLTLICVVTGFDWWWFTHTRGEALQTLLFGAVVIGGLLPMVTPLVLLLVSFVVKSKNFVVVALAVLQAEMLGFFISGFYKSLTGRPGPPMSVGAQLTDISQMFRFGFWRGGVFWGWPSSHTTVAFAMAMTIFTLYPKNKAAQLLSVAYALYIGIGISTNIHWFSDFIAGAIIGTVVGVTVGKSFLQRITHN